RVELLERPLRGVRDEEVEVAVAVGVEEARRLRLGDEHETRVVRRVPELPAAGVLEVDVAPARRRDVQVLVAVAVRVGPRRGDADLPVERGSESARVLRDVGELPVARVAEEAARTELVAEEDVVLLVAVEVADRDAAAV